MVCNEMQSAVRCKQSTSNGEGGGSATAGKFPASAAAALMTGEMACMPNNVLQGH